MTYEYESLDLNLIKQVIMDSDIKGFYIEQETGYARSAVSNLRSGKRKFEGIKLENLLTLQDWLNRGEWLTLVNQNNYSKEVIDKYLKIQ